MQWLKAYFDRVNPSLEGYNPAERRKGKAPQGIGNDNKQKEQKADDKVTDLEPEPNSKKEKPKNADQVQKNENKDAPKEKKGTSEADLRKELKELKDSVVYASNERDFYFNKLTLVEELLNGYGEGSERETFLRNTV